MKKECDRTRKAFQKYLHGHVFKGARDRIERHLGKCVLCRSEFEALRRSEETRQFLRDINASGGVVGRMKDGVSSLVKLKKILYRPLLIAGIALVAGAVVYYVVTPRQLVVEIENIVESLPTTSEPSATPPHAPAARSEAASAQTATRPARPAAPAPKPAPESPRDAVNGGELPLRSGTAAGPGDQIKDAHVP